MERKIKTLFLKGFFVFMFNSVFTSCVTTRHNVEVGDYLLLENGMTVLGKEKGLTCFFFENDQGKVPFQQFLISKYNLGATENVSYYVFLEGKRFQVFFYDYDDLMKYYDLSQFMVTRSVTDVNRIGATTNFLGMSVIDENNNDCLAENSLFQNLILKYLKDLKQEFYNS